MISIFTDGASRGNPGNSGIGVAIYDSGKLIEKISEYCGKKTNNQSEYLALIRGLEYLNQNNINSCNFFSDSEFLVKQMNGIYKVKSENVKPLYKNAVDLAKGKIIKYNWIPRKDNELADKLANEGIDRHFSKKSINLNINENNATIKNKSMSNLILDKSFFGKINCLKIQMSQDFEIYFHMGILEEKTKKWNWEIVKMSDIELGEIINLLKKEVGSCSFFHQFNDKKTQLWCNKSEKGFSLKIGKVSKNLSIGESEVFKIILEESIRKRVFDI